MNKHEAGQRVAKLKKEIEHHRYLYHVKDTQEISDAALDSLKHELYQLEQDYPELITADSPTQRVGGLPSVKFSKVQHSHPILSLEDVFSMEEAYQWEAKNQKIISGPYQYYGELKLDGLTVVLTYYDGVLFRGATRGDGQTGEDVTENLKTIESIPLELNAADKNLLDKIPKVFEVRGEVVMTKSVFAKINQEQARLGLPLYANPRNVAAGSIRQLDPKVTAQRKLDCFAFEIITDLGQKTHEEVHHILNRLGFKTDPQSVFCKNLAAVEKYIQQWQTKRLQLDYQTDGVVVVINDLGIARRLGSIGKAERWMVAYKFPAEQATTLVQDITVQVGRTGALTPVALLKPVRIAGTTVSRATLHNLDEIKRLDIRIGDTVIIQKAGDIIPDIVRVLPKLRTGREKRFNMPKKCPICRNVVFKPAGEVNYYCSNKKCFAVERERLIHFVSRKGFNIEGLGPKIIEQLVNEGLIAGPADLFKLTVGDLQPLERFAEKSAQNLVKAIQSSKKIELAKLIYALGIRHVGEETADALAEHFGSLAKIQSAGRADLAAISDIGEVVAASIVEYFKDNEHRQFLKDLKKVGTEAFQTVSRQLSKIAGKTFALTGTLSWLTRDEAKDKIRQAGGKIAGTVSRRTDYVVAGANPGAKYDQALNLGVNIITDKDFLELLK